MKIVTDIGQEETITQKELRLLYNLSTNEAIKKSLLILSKPENQSVEEVEMIKSLYELSNKLSKLFEY